MGFTGGRHLLYKAMQEAQIMFPAGRDEIGEKLRNCIIQTSEYEFTDAENIIKKLPQEKFDCASAFWCAYTSVASSELKKKKSERVLERNRL